MIKEENKEKFYDYGKNFNLSNDTTIHGNKKIDVLFSINENQEDLYQIYDTIERLKDYFDYLKQLAEELEKNIHV